MREIQEAEVKKQESKKLAEKEKERVRPVIPQTESKEDTQPFTVTTAWGLPTSQTGNRSSASLAIREPPAASPSNTTPTTPVWAAPVKIPAVKKSMKEIQEEEEARKKQSAAKESAAAAAAAQKRVYVETTTKVNSSVEFL